MTYWPARTYLKIIDHKFTVQRECGNGPLQAMLSGDVIILRGCVRRNSGPSGGRENRHGYTPYLHAVCKGSFQFQRRPGISSLGLARSGRVVAEERRGRAADNKLTG